MSKSVGLISGLSLLTLCVVAFAIGAYLLVMSSAMQPHADEMRAQEFSSSYTDNYLKAPEQLEAIASQIAALRTSKYELYDAGLSLCLLFGTLLIGVVRFALWDLRNLRAVQTPRSRARLLALATIALLGLVPALIIQADIDWLRDDLAPTIDTGREMIAVVAPAPFLMLWPSMFLIGRFLILRRSSFPANLLRWDSVRSRRSVALNAGFGMLVALLTILLIGSVLYFVTAIPTIMIGIYVLLSSRAALLEHAASGHKQKFSSRSE